MLAVAEQFFQSRVDDPLVKIRPNPFVLAAIVRPTRYRAIGIDATATGLTVKMATVAIGVVGNHVGMA